MLRTRNDLRQHIRFITKLQSRPRSKDHRPTMTSFSQLSVELKTMVFSYLDRPTDCHSCWDLTMASLINREWQELAGHPDLWQEYRVTGGKRKLVGLLKSSRFLEVKYVEVGTREKIDKTEV